MRRLCLALSLLATAPAIAQDDGPSTTSEAPPPAVSPTEEASSAPPAPRPADLRLVVTGGLSGLRDGTESFWDSAVFRGAGGLRLRVLQAGAEAFRAGDVILVAEEGALTREDVLAASRVEPGPREPTSLLLGPNAIGAALLGSPSAETQRALTRGLAAVARPAALERRVVGDKVVVALDLSPQTPLVWPDADTTLAPLPAARVVVGSERAPFFLIARGKGATPRAFGIVDGLLRAPDEPPTAYLDVGGALTDTGDASPQTARAMRELLLARDPAVLTAGRAELTALQASSKILDDGPWLLAAEPPKKRALPPAIRRARVGGRQVLFAALGGVGARTSSLLPPGARALSADETIALAAAAADESEPALVLGIALSPEGVDAALTSSLFDSVLHLASSRLAALPAVDDIDLRENHRTGLHAGPGLARVSSADVTEIRYWFDAEGRVERMRIERHAVVDEGPEAVDARAALAARPARDATVGGLPARATLTTSTPAGGEWTRQDLNHLVGGLVRAEERAEVSVLPSLPAPVPVEGAVPAPLARAWLSTRDRVVVLTLKGAQLTPLFDVVRTRLASSLVVTGADLERRTVALRAIAPLEDYRVALSEQALLEVQHAGLVLPVPPDAREEARRISELVDDSLARTRDTSEVLALLREPAGRPRHALLLELADVAAGFTVHTLSNASSFTEVRDARVRTPDSLAVTLNGRGMLGYEGPFVGAALLGTTQLVRNTLRAPDGSETLQELRDLLLLEADVRLPLPRLLDSDPLYTPQPGVRVTYDTEWTPSESVDKAGAPVTLPRKSLLRGFVGGTWTPSPYLKELRLGAIVQNDFAEESEGSLEWGGEAALSGEWPAGTVKLKLDSYLRALVPDPDHDTADDLGLIFQTIARVELPTFWNLNVAAFGDLYVVSGKLPETRGPAVSVIVGAQLGYANRLKWLPLM